VSCGARLARLAVGLTHAHRGSATGASRSARAAERIEPYAAEAPHGVPVTALTGWTRNWRTASIRKGWEADPARSDTAR
jgi:hypothetical protein